MYFISISMWRVKENMAQFISQSSTKLIKYNHNVDSTSHNPNVTHIQLRRFTELYNAFAQSIVMAVTGDDGKK